MEILYKQFWLCVCIIFMGAYTSICKYNIACTVLFVLDLYAWLLLYEKDSMAWRNVVCTIFEAILNHLLIDCYVDIASI